jgi:hypothetical protein
MLKEIVIFSIGVVVGNHNINMPTGIAIGGATPTN